MHCGGKRKSIYTTIIKHTRGAVCIRVRASRADDDDGLGGRRRVRLEHRACDLSNARTRLFARQVRWVLFFVGLMRGDACAMEAEVKSDTLMLTVCGTKTTETIEQVRVERMSGFLLKLPKSCGYFDNSETTAMVVKLNTLSIQIMDVKQKNINK